MPFDGLFWFHAAIVRRSADHPRMGDEASRHSFPKRRPVIN